MFFLISTQIFDNIFQSSYQVLFDSGLIFNLCNNKSHTFPNLFFNLQVVCEGAGPLFDGVDKINSCVLKMNSIKTKNELHAFNFRIKSVVVVTISQDCKHTVRVSIPWGINQIECLLFASEINLKIIWY